MIDAKPLGGGPGVVQLDPVPLAVVDRQQGEPGTLRTQPVRQHGAVQPTGHDHHRVRGRLSSSLLCGGHDAPAVTPARARNSVRTAGWAIRPRVTIVTADAATAQTPRSVMQACAATRITPTPSGAMCSSSQSATWTVS